MKRSCLIIIISVCVQFTMAQGPELKWYHQTFEDEALTIDADGNAFEAGLYLGLHDFDPGPGVAELNTFPFGASQYILKYSSDKEFIWVKELVSHADSYVPYGIRFIETDADGNLFLLGTFNGEIDFDPGPDEYLLSYPEDGHPSLFLLKLNPDGEFLWVNMFELITESEFGSHYTRAHDLAIDINGDVYFGGRLAGSMDFDSSADDLILSTDDGDVYDAFITKISSDGEIVWAKQFGGPFDEQVLSLDSDSEGDVVMVGSFKKETDLDPSFAELLIVSEDSFASDAFISQFDPNGDLIWGYHFETDNTTGSWSHETAWEVSVGPDDEIVVIGFGECAVDFDLMAGEEFYDLSEGLYASGYIVKYTNEAGLVWVNPHYMRSYALDIDKDGAVYTAGNLVLEFDFDPGPDEYLVAPEDDNSDVYINKLDAAGDHVWTGLIRGRFADVALDYLVVDDEYNVYFGVGAGDSIDFAPQNDVDEWVDFSHEMWDRHYSVMLSHCVLNDVSITNEGGLLVAHPSGDYTYQWIDCEQGGVVNPALTEDTFLPTENGTYAVIVSYDGCIDTSDCITYNSLHLTDVDLNDFNIYPNPATSTFTIVLDNSVQSASTRVQLFSLTGEIVKDIPLNNIPNPIIDVSDLEKGIYEVRLFDSNDGIALKKLIIQ